MLGSHPISAILGAQIEATSDTSRIRSYLKGLTEVGLHVLLCRPGTKEPLDLRSKKQIEDDNAAHREFVREMWTAIGRQFTDADLDKIEAPGGVHLATNDVARLRLYVNKFRKAFGDGTEDKEGNFRPVAPVTLAVSVGPSKLLVVDCDTAEQRLAFGDWMAKLSGRPELSFTTPTVLSPGVFRDGQWIHRDGGHYYFAVGDVALPENMGNIKVEHNGEKFDIFWDDRYVLIPPSERTEGKYERVGPVLNLSDNLWLKTFIDNHAEEKAARHAARAEESLPPEVRQGLIEWYSNVTWASLLEPHGWERTGDDKACGCEQWGRPGRSHDKSATAHIPGCTRTEYLDSPDPPIHFWTSFPGREIEDKLSEVGGNTLSKLQLYAALEHGGHDFLAMNTITELPARISVTVIEIGGVKVGASTGSLVYEFEDDGDVFGTGVIDAPNMDQAALPYADQPTAPTTPVSVLPQPSVPSPTPAIQPATTLTTPTPAPTHVGVQFGMSSSSSENLVEPAGSNITAAATDFSKIATTPATVPATTPDMGSDTGVATQADTVESTTRYEQRYDQVNTGSPWDTDDDKKDTDEIVRKTVEAMTPVITASVVEALKASGVIPK